VKELGLSWAVLDDGWQIAEGDWRPNPAKFPRGDEDMKALVARIHAAGLKARLWWAPLAADPGVPIDPDLRVRDSSGQPVKISWWDADYLCPVHPKVRELTAKFVAKALGEWGFDGLKIDGQHLNGSPLCHHPKHGHARPEESAESVPGFFEAVYRSARETKPHALLELCPCGATASFYNMPWMNQAVSSDPESSWQIRLKAKTFKALIGPSAAYHGDHVELSEGQRDFASTVGVGGVIGTKFTSPLAPGVKPEFLLTPEKEKVWRHWIQLSRELDLPRGQYRGELYDLGYDRPEAHVIEKGGELFYAFYGASHRGKVALRGLAAGRRYALRDYANGVDLGSATGPEHEIEVSFTGALLVRATP
jgi:alpha-galactosidase